MMTIEEITTILCDGCNRAPMTACQEEQPGVECAKVGLLYQIADMEQGFHYLSAELTRVTAERDNLLAQRKDYEEAEEQGLLVRLPCKRGDKVWRICGPKGRKFVAERTVLSVTIYNPGEFETFTNCFDWLGKTVFLTRGEAEKALKKANKNG